MPAILNGLLRFVGGGLVGSFLGLSLLIAVQMLSFAVQSRGPDPGGPGVRVHTRDSFLRVTQTCRGGCDEIRP